MIRPIIEYGDIIYDNTSLKNKLKLDNLQRRAAIICTGAYRHTETQSLLHELAWEPLAKRRYNHKIIQIFKIINGIYPNYLLEPITPIQNDVYNFRNNHRFHINRRRTESSNTSFYPSTIRIWYSLPHNLTDSVTVAQLRRKLLLDKPRPSMYFKLCSGKQGILLTRLRLGLSALNSHRFKYNLITSPICEICNLEPETTDHFFHTCPSYLNARQRFYDRLTHELNIDVINLNKSILTNILLQGLIDSKLQSNLLQIIFEYITDTGRFN